MNQQQTWVLVFGVVVIVTAAVLLGSIFRWEALAFALILAGLFYKYRDSN